MAKRWLRALKPVKELLVFNQVFSTDQLKANIQRTPNARSERRRNRIIRNLDRMDAINQKV